MQAALVLVLKALSNSSRLQIAVSLVKRDVGAFETTVSMAVETGSPADIWISGCYAMLALFMSSIRYICDACTPVQLTTASQSFQTCASLDNNASTCTLTALAHYGQSAFDNIQ